MNEENAGKCCLSCSYIYEVNHVEIIWRSTEYDATRKLHQWEIVRDCFFTILPHQRISKTCLEKVVAMKGLIKLC